MNSIHISLSSFITSPILQQKLPIHTNYTNSSLHCNFNTTSQTSLLHQTPTNICCISASSSPSPQQPKSHFNASTKLFNVGLSFRTTEESLRNAFENFGQLVDVNLVMDKIANRPKGFAFVRYSTEEESKKAIEGMHGKFLDGRVIFVEVAKPKSEVRRGPAHY